jgi:hypothetical protein
VSTIDKQRIEAVSKLEKMGYTFVGGEWRQPDNETVAPSIMDALHALVVRRADALSGCTAGSEEERELAAITDAIEAYERARWPDGRTDGGKG